METKNTFEHGSVCEIRANIDDMTAEDMGAVMEKLLSDGALDVWFQPIQMKKNRPGVMLSLLVPCGEKEKFAENILRHTSTFGVRIYEPQRIMLARRIKTVNTKFGPVRVKEGLIGGKTVKSTAEYEDVKKIARDTGLPISLVRREIDVDERTYNKQ